MISAFFRGIRVEGGADDFCPNGVSLYESGPKVFRNLTVSASINLYLFKSFFAFTWRIRKARTRFTYELFLAIDY
jgi:hypothetical protein